MNDAVEISIANGVADLRLNRPDKMNAVDEGDCSRTLMGTPNQLEAVMSTFEKREPQFVDPQ